MELVLLTALGVGSATVIGAIIGFAFKKISHKFSDNCKLLDSMCFLVIPHMAYMLVGFFEY